MKPYWELFRVVLFAIVLSIVASVLVPIPTTVRAASSNLQSDPTVEADLLIYEGGQLLQSGHYTEALEKFEQALVIYQTTVDPYGDGEALCYIAIGLAQENLGNNSGALEAYQASLPYWKEVGDQHKEAAVLERIGTNYISLAQYQQAIDSFILAMPIAQAIEDRLTEGKVFSGLGVAYYYLGQYKQALEYDQQALRIAVELGNKGAEGIATNNIGLVYYELAQYSQALEYYQRALTIQRQVGNESGEANTLNSIGGVYHGLGQYESALDAYQKALAISRRAGDQRLEAAGLASIGVLYDKLGRYRQALDNYQRALEIEQQVGDLAGEEATLKNIADTYSNLGQYAKAVESYLLALQIAQQIGDSVGAGNVLNSIAGVYHYIGQDTEALNYYQMALSIVQETGYRSGEGSVLNNIGSIYEDQGQYVQALEYYQRALIIQQEIGDRSGVGVTLNNMGGVYHSLGQYEQALASLQQALDVSQEIGELSVQPSILSNIGLIHERQGNKTLAISSYQQAIEITESIQSDLKIAELKSSFAANKMLIYENLSLLLWDEGRFAEAFNYVERARARAFLDQLAQGTIDLNTGSDAKLFERQQTLKKEVDALRAQLISLKNLPQNEWDADAIAATQTELTDRENSYAQLLIDIKLQNPEVASLESVDVTSLADVQSLLDSDTALVEYFVTEERTLVFIITRNTFDAVAINVRRLDLVQAITNFHDFASLQNPHPASLKQLYTWLILPVQDKLKTPIVGIIPHGVLHYLPFASLTDGTQYLVDGYSLFTLPSASVLRFIQKKRKPEIETVLVFGNPSTELPSLQFAEQEANSIASLYHDKPVIRSSATESLFKLQAGKAGILHLAAHGEYDAYNPLFSSIHLATDAQNDGLLEVHEVYGLDLTKTTDLVVLSACQTNVGAVSMGDEIVGLNRAFIYAGSPTVIASLWNVDDAATAQLMKSFYTHLRNGMSKAEALQAAQKEVRDNPDWAHPYYWAAFVLTGDPGATRALHTVLPSSINNWGRWTAGIGIIFLVVLAGTVFVLTRGTGAEKRRLHEQLKLLLMQRQHWLSQPDTPMRTLALKHISHKLREIGAQYSALERKGRRIDRK